MGNVGYETGTGSTRAQDAASTAQEKASELREQGQSKLREQLDTRSTDAGSQMRSAAGALRESTNNLRNEGNTTAANVTGQVADRVERLGSYLEQRSGDEMMRDVEDFARRRPWLIAGAGLLAGFAASRFVKASSEGRYPGSGRASGYRGGYEPLPAGQSERWPERQVEPLADAPIARDPADSFGAA